MVSENLVLYIQTKSIQRSPNIAPSFERQIKNTIKSLAKAENEWLLPMEGCTDLIFKFDLKIRIQDKRSTAYWELAAILDRQQSKEIQVFLNSISS